MPLPTKPNSLNDPTERERLLMQYAGIFPNNIKEYGETIAKRINKPRKNYAR